MKKQLGQFFTTNSDYILQGLERYIREKVVIDPFAGNQDLIKWAKKNKCRKIIGYDCDSNFIDNKSVYFNDSINSPKIYDFVCTNPPYLHKNKAAPDIKDKFFSGKNGIFEDLYQISINSILKSKEGILIVPLNFLCAENSKRIRDLFFEKFEIVRLNIFSRKVFDDTTYNVISFYYRRKKNLIPQNEIKATIYPEKKQISFIIEKVYNWQLGGDFINRMKNTRNELGIFRLTEDYLNSGEYEVEIALQNIKDRKLLSISRDIKKLLENNILFLRAIDSKGGKKIQLEDIRDYNLAGLVGKNSSRNMAHLIFRKTIPVCEQLKLMKKFNQVLNENREKYFSFFLTNFRDNNRKRISFDLAYKFLNYLYYEQRTKQPALF